MRAKVVSKHVGARKNDVKMCVAREYFLTHLGLNYRENVYELEIMLGKRH